MRLPHFQIHFPATLKEALDLGDLFSQQGRYLAGGTDILVLMKQRALSAKDLIDISALPEINEIHTLEGGVFEIGAGVSLSRVASSKLVQKHAPCLSEAAEAVASVQVRNMGTVGGNLCQSARCRYYNRSRTLAKLLPLCLKRGGEVCHIVPNAGRCYAAYQGDLAAALFAHQAMVRVATKENFRLIPIEALFSGDGKSPLTLAPGELIAAVRIEKSRKGNLSRYKKYRLRGGIDYPLVGVGIHFMRSSAEFAEGVTNIGITGVDSKPFGISLAGFPDEEALTHAIRERVHPVNNLGGTAWHRRIMAQQMALDLLGDFRIRMEGTGR
jgi:4-hydroxybenzoyl-CoA reductase subunit beta